ncbi:hypothetical protein [Roseivirga sp.]|uniref:hypothetical protein n=1 Tax=Roseivirga sp. TaxID=1964215 RepID=UPI003B8CB5A6
MISIIGSSENLFEDLLETVTVIIAISTLEDLVFSNSKLTSVYSISHLILNIFFTYLTINWRVNTTGLILFLMAFISLYVFLGSTNVYTQRTSSLKHRKVDSFWFFFRNKPLTKRIAFILSLDLVALIFFDVFILESFKKILVVTFLTPLPLMTNYGNNTFGSNPKLTTFRHSLNGDQNIASFYYRLILVPLSAFVLLRIVFLGLYMDRESLLSGLLTLSFSTINLSLIGLIFSIEFPLKMTTFQSKKIKENASLKPLKYSILCSLLCVSFFFINVVAILIFNVILMIILAHKSYHKVQKYNSLNLLEKLY